MPTAEGRPEPGSGKCKRYFQSCTILPVVKQGAEKTTIPEVPRSSGEGKPLLGQPPGLHALQLMCGVCLYTANPTTNHSHAYAGEVKR